MAAARCLVLLALVTGPALAADYDYVDPKGFRHWNHEGPRRHHPEVRPYQHRSVAVAPKHEKVDHTALFREFLYGKETPVALPQGNSAPPPAWAGTIEDAVKRWPHRY